MNKRIDDILATPDQILNINIANSLFAQRYSHEQAQKLVDVLKAEADKHWNIDPQISVDCAKKIIAIGTTNENLDQIALGKMALGDALKFMGTMQEAWDTLAEAGQIFLKNNNTLGWSRTRIGRLWIATEINMLEVALAEATEARRIFEASNEPVMLMRLIWNIAAVHNHLGQHQRAIEIYEEACSIVKSLGSAEQKSLSYLYSNIGYAHRYLGNFQQARTYHENARQIFIKLGEKRAIAIENHNIAGIAMLSGYYHEALQLLHEIENTDLPVEIATAQRLIVECYYQLSRWDMACELGEKTIAQFREMGADYIGVAQTSLWLAMAQAQMGDYVQAQATLHDAEQIYKAREAWAWVAVVWLRRGQIALQQGDSAAAQIFAYDSKKTFEAIGRKAEYAEACLLYAKTCRHDDEKQAHHYALIALNIAEQGRLNTIAYGAYVFLGELAEKQGKISQAIECYCAGFTLIDTIQRELTITLRPNFLQDKDAAFHALIRLYLHQGKIHEAFNVLERVKAQVSLNYITNQKHLRWSAKSPKTHMMLDELVILRKEHEGLTQLLSALQEEPIISHELQETQAELRQRELAIRKLVEKLYLFSKDDGIGRQINSPNLASIQSKLPENALLVEFYSNDTQVWVFAVDANLASAHILKCTPQEITALLEQIQRNINRALRVPPLSNIANRLNDVAQRLGEAVFWALLEPIKAQLPNYEQIIFVPYGQLHYLPFNLLRYDGKYLIESYEMVVQPSAALIGLASFNRKAGILFLGHTWSGKLPQVVAEAQMLREQIAGNYYLNEKATQTRLQTEPSQILHIAAHGVHYMDKPEFSYIQLADGQIFADDLLQYDLAYELVILSACETGMSVVVPGDELIGIGRAFLYAGAGALIATLWRINDSYTVQLMRAFYFGLEQERSKAQALRYAQCQLLNKTPNLHPAYWAAFQLTGNPNPLTNLEILDGD